MLTIKTDIGNFGDWHSLYMEMVNTNTDKVLANCSYCFQHIATINLTLSDVEALESDKLIDDNTLKTIENFVQAFKKIHNEEN